MCLTWLHVCAPSNICAWFLCSAAAHVAADDSFVQNPTGPTRVPTPGVRGWCRINPCCCSPASMPTVLSTTVAPPACRGLAPCAQGAATLCGTQSSCALLTCTSQYATCTLQIRTYSCLFHTTRNESSCRRHLHVCACRCLRMTLFPVVIRLC